MVLISKERKASPEFQQQFGHITHQGPLNIPFDHIFTEWNEVKNIWILHRLEGQFALWGRQAGFKIGDLLSDGLPLVEAALNLMDLNIV